MSDKNIENYIDKFYKGELNSHEEEDFKIMINETSYDKNSDLKAYFSLKSKGKSQFYSPISKEEFFNKIESNRKAKTQRRYWIAASLIGIFMVSILVFIQLNNQKSIQKAEVDRSMEITKLALNSFSKHMNLGYEKIEKGMDFSIPYHSLSKIKSETKNK